MSTNFTVIDAIYRSRMTLLEILTARGYDVERFTHFTPAEATLAVTSSADTSHTAAHFAGLSFTAAKREEPQQVCDVRYILNLGRNKLNDFFNNVSDNDAPNTEVIVMLLDPLSDMHHVSALKQYLKVNEEGQRRKLRVSFFNIYTIVINPLKHVLVPKHEIVPEAEQAELMKSLYINTKQQFPEIKFHIDPITRCIGAVPGDIIKITRPSASSGEAIIYRVCTA